MTACCGTYHTITLSNDGTLHSFGYNGNGQLGLGHNNNVSLPSHIPTLPKIKQVSCGAHFTVCVDYEGFIWSFGYNNYGQLGIGNTTITYLPQKFKRFLLFFLFLVDQNTHWSSQMIQIFGDVDIMDLGSYASTTKKINQNFKKHHFLTFRK